MSRRSFLWTGAAAAAGIGLYAATHARHELEVTERALRLPGLAPEFDGFRIAQLSDIHFDEYTEPFFVREVVRRTNEVAADMVVLTGDYISRGPLSLRFAREKADECAELLSGLTCPLRFGVLGNHDASVDSKHISAMLQERGIPVLRDQYLPIERGGAHFWLCGADDPGVNGCNLEKTIPEKPDAPVLFLAHEPDFADVLRTSMRYPNVSAMLSGHSHGGQVRLPFLGPLILPPLGERYVQGAFQLGHMQLYVNRGVGTVGVPFRLNCPPEITVFTLSAAAV